MSDVVVLLQDTPDPAVLLDALLAAGGDLRVASLSYGAALRLSDDDGAVVLMVEVPLLVQVGGEFERLLGVRVDVPVCGWTCTPAPGGPRWPGTWGRPSWTGSAASWCDPELLGPLPTADLVTGRAAVVLADRPVVALTRSLADTAVRCAERGLMLLLVTPPTARLTWPLEELLSAEGACWVVQDADGRAVDGLRRTPLSWDEAFLPVGDEVPATEVDPAGGSVVDVSVLNAAREDTVLGGALEDAVVGLTGEPPQGWGVAEPAASRWDRAALTRLCRDRAPARTALVAVGGYRAATGIGTVGTLSVRRVPAGLVERVRLFVGYAAPPSADVLDGLARALARHQVRSAVVGLRPGRSDGTVGAGRSHAALPVGLLVGVEGAGTLVPSGEQLGTARRPAEWLRLDPRDPGALARTLALVRGGGWAQRSDGAVVEP